MPNTFRIITVFIALLLWLTGGCASDRPPSGGPLDRTSLQVVFSDPAPSALNVSTDRILLTFNYALTGRQLLNALRFSPDVGGYDIAVSGKNAEIKFVEPFEKGRTYTLTLDKNLRDYQGRTFAAPYSLAFSTGAIIDSGTIGGKILNRDNSTAKNAIVLIYADNPAKPHGNNLLNEKPDYLLQASSSGVFAFNHIRAGSYRVIAVNDRNHDLRYNSKTEEIALCSAELVPTGSSSLLFRFPEPESNSGKPLPIPLNKLPRSAERGTISGKCFAKGAEVVVEAKSSDSNSSCSTMALRDKNGTFHYTLPDLPPGSYTLSAFIPSVKHKTEAYPQWNPGSIEPYQPAEPFGFFPEKVMVRAQWTIENIDIRIMSLPLN